MADEFQESDVIFSDHLHHRLQDSDHGGGGGDSSFFDNFRSDVMAQPPRHQHQHQQWMSSNKSSKIRNKSSNNKMVANSLPVNIPAESIFRCMDDDAAAFAAEEDEWEDEGMVPPHVLVARRIAGKMAFSVCTGNGRTLKGRDLSRVRNSILRMTGFLET